MKRQVIVLPEAKAEATEAALWHEANRTGWGDAHLDAVDDALLRIREHPERYTGDEAASRRFPSGSAHFADDVSRSGVTTITRRINENAYPVLFLSSGRISWDVVRVYHE